MQISKRVKVFFVFWLVIPVLVVVPVRAADQSSGVGRIIKSASELDYPPFALVRSDGTADGFSVDLLKEVVRKTRHLQQEIQERRQSRTTSATIRVISVSLDSRPRLVRIFPQEGAQKYYPDMDIYDKD